MKDKETLEKMVDALIKNKSEEAQVDFHQYLSNKMKGHFNQGEDLSNENPKEDD